MDLWVRSQDKMLLTKSSEIGICELCGSYNIIIRNNEQQQLICGTYNTKEKALKVLDKIQKLLVPCYIMQDYNSSLDMLIQNKDREIKVLPRECVVYQMPSDHEVEKWN